ncbi:MAG: hypothetical protein AAGC85_01735, partial [Bacteroidota bacterium]
GYADTTFNAFKTWVEYINRLIGVLIGLFALATAAYSLKLRKAHAKVTLFSVGLPKLQRIGSRSQGK